jgi:hypothetical protein
VALIEKIERLRKRERERKTHVDAVVFGLISLWGNFLFFSVASMESHVFRYYVILHHDKA